MREIHRVLKTGGYGILQVPLAHDLATTREDPAVVSKRERKAIYGQKDHLRLYGLDYFERLGRAGDRAIDGCSYVLRTDGNVMKFLGGERQPFEIQGIPEGLGEIAGFAVDPEGDGTVYIADRGHNRIVVLGPDGRFQSQLRAEPPLTSLEALAVNQAEGQLYVLAAGQVYAAALP
jgi:hypothetical protein